MRTKGLAIFTVLALATSLSARGAEEAAQAPPAAEVAPAATAPSDPATPADAPADPVAPAPADPTGPATAEPSDASAAVEPAAPAAEEAQMPAAAMPPEAPAAEPAPVLGPVGYDAEGRPGRIHTVARGDTLWDISKAYLGTPWVWPSIWSKNEDIANPHLIRPGDRIWISPNEMRRISAEEAARLLAGTPAAAPEAGPASVDESAMVPEEAPPRPRYHASFLEHVGILATGEIEAAASILEARNERVWLGTLDPVVVGLGAGAANVGDRFTVFRVGDEVLDPDTRERFGSYVDVLGWLEITEVHPESSIGVIRVANTEMRAGDRIVPRRKLDPDIELQPGPGGVEGRLVYFPDSRTEMGGDDVVFLNRGALHGLAVGSALEVFRSGDQKTDAVQGDRLTPDLVVAKLVVVSAQETTAVAVVTHSATELEHGDRFRGANP
jgi:hypothetical protein